MKNLLILIIASLAFYTCDSGTTNAPAVVGTGDFTNFAMTEIPGTSLKKAERLDNEGNISEEGNVMNEQKEGTWVLYYNGRDQGKVKTITNFHKGIKNGLELTFAKNGTVETKSRFINGKLNGEYAKYKSSRLLELANYKDEKLEGIYKTYYQNGKIQQEANYKDGKKHGKSTYYNQEEQVTMEYEYKNGEQVSGGKVEVPKTVKEEGK